MRAAAAAEAQAWPVAHKESPQQQCWLWLRFIWCTALTEAQYADAAALTLSACAACGYVHGRPPLVDVLHARVTSDHLVRVITLGGVGGTGSREGYRDNCSVQHCFRPAEYLWRPVLHECVGRHNMYSTVMMLPCHHQGACCTVGMRHCCVLPAWCVIISTVTSLPLGITSRGLSDSLQPKREQQQQQHLAVCSTA
jgi:hypothetical protein